MVRGLGRLPFLARRSGRAEASPSDDLAMVRKPIDPELAPLGPPVLLPRMIFRQVLFDATELVPAWAMPRAEPAFAAPVEAPKAKRARRPKEPGSSTATPKATTPRRSRASAGTSARRA